jgi:hypothetical protein
MDHHLTWVQLLEQPPILLSNRYQSVFGAMSKDRQGPPDDQTASRISTAAN